MNYKEECIKAMDLLAEDDRVIFLGQNICYEGSPAYETMVNIPDRKKLEMPVAEDMQMGISIGLSLEGYIPVSIYPRIDFLLLAINQLVNHLDKIKEMSVGRFSPKIIIRTMIGATKPLDPGIQHCGNYTKGLKALLHNVTVIELDRTGFIVPIYKRCLTSPGSKILIEYAEKIREA